MRRGALMFNSVLRSKRFSSETAQSFEFKYQKAMSEGCCYVQRDNEVPAQ